ncbi:ABC transporter permease subunit [Streptomyces sp. NPDC004830]
MSSLTYDLTLAGLSVGAAAALTGIGLIVTYRATGVLNFAHGAIAMVCAYALRQCVVEWGWPLWLGAVVTLLVLAPGLGVVLERFVFRPLSVLGPDPARALVASLGVFVLLVGGAALLWGQGARDDAPVLVPDEPWGQLAVVLVLAAGVAVVVRRTRFGRELRAVVDDRRLAVLGGIDADRVAAAGWAFGAFTAGLTGVLLAPYVRLDPYGLPLLVMEVVAVAVAARMRGTAVAVVLALAIGVAQSQLTRLHPPGWGEPLLRAAGTNLFVVALLVAALVLPGVGTRDALPPPAAARAPASPGAWVVALVLFLLPLGLAGRDLHTSVQVPALAVILLSLVVVTGRAGQISLGQAAYAGLGALFTALLAAGRFPGLPRLPELAALAVAVVLVAPLGLLTGGPAIRRRGLALALATFAVGVGVNRFVFTQPYATAGLTLGRPAGFDGDRAYYALELLLLAVALAVTHLLRRGRTGRALAALRDHEAGARATGVRVPSLKLLAFVVGAALAALGGGMLGMGLRAFDAAAYDPVRGLLWFAAVIVLGADSTLGALAAAALLVGLDAGARGGVAAALIGVLAILVGRFPGGAPEVLRTARARLRPRPTATLTSAGTRVREKLRAAAPGGYGTGRVRVRVPMPLGATATGAGTPSRLRSPTRTPHPARRPLNTPGTPVVPPPDPGTARRTLLTRATRPSRRPSNTPGTPAAPPTSATGAPATVAPVTSSRLRRLLTRATHPGRRPPSAPGTPGVPPPDTGTARRTLLARATRPGRRPSNTPDAPAAPPTSATGTAATAAPATSSRLRRLLARATHPGRRPPAAPAAPALHPEATPGSPGESDMPAASRTLVPPSGPAGPLTSAIPAVRPAGGPAPPLLSARRLHVRYGGGFTALDGVGLDLFPGRITAVVGPNGAGKSTLFHCLAGTVRPARGAVRFDGRDITALPAQARTRLGVARTFQELAVFPSLTVAENVRVGAEQGRPGGAGGPGAVERTLRLFGLDGPVRARPAAGLPTGTLRRVELARALAGDPRVLLLDEPAAGLDTAEVAALAAVLKALAADGTALLVVEHDLDLVADLADVVHVMNAGRIVASGPPARVLDAPGTGAGA